MQLKARMRRQRGAALMESLVALLVLAVGILGLALAQTQMLVESKGATQRALAIGLIDDLSNRMSVQRVSASLQDYALAWGADPGAADCLTKSCDDAQLVRADLHAWRAQVLRQLPDGDAHVFAADLDPRQIGVVIAWPEADSALADADRAKYQRPFAITKDNSGVDCPSRFICHLAYVQP